MTSSLFSSISNAFERFSTQQNFHQPQLAYAGFPSGATPPMMRERSSVITRASVEIEPNTSRPELNEEDNILHLDDTEWDRVIEESHKQTVIVDIWAEWCKSCDQASDHFYKAADQNRDKPITFIKFDIANNKVVGKEQGLKALPNVRVYKNGVFTENKGLEIRGTNIRFAQNLDKLVDKAL